MRSRLRYLPLATLFVLAFATGYRGIDYGGHWDEPRMRRTVQSVVQRGAFLPGWYQYPSVTWGIVAAALLPDMITHSGDPLEIVKRNVFDDRDALRVRAVFLGIVLLSLVWVYLLVLRWRGSHAESLLAAALLGGSWEVAYHARWVAPDGILLQFAALFALTLCIAAGDPQRRLRGFVAAAVVAGLACGSKYPGGILLFPLLVFAVRADRADPTRRRWLWVLVAFAATFVATTPGAIFDFRQFVTDVGSEVRHYAGGHPGYSVRPGPFHFALNIEYLTLVAFSHYWPNALAIFVFAIVGVAYVIRRQRHLAWLLWVPFVYLVYMSMQRVMFVRNLEILLPFLAVLSARGIAWTYIAVKSRGLRALMVVAVAAAILLNFAWLVYAAETIANRNTLPKVDHVLRYINEHADDRLFCSSTIGEMLGVRTVDMFPGNLTSDRHAADRYLVNTCDGYDRIRWEGNRRGRWQVVSGPYEVNFDYYPTWGAHCRIVAIDADFGATLGAFRGQKGTTIRDPSAVDDEPSRRP